MAPHVCRVMKGKKLLLLKSLLVEYGYDDLGVMDELISGAPMTGAKPSTPSQKALTPDHKPCVVKHKPESLNPVVYWSYRDYIGVKWGYIIRLQWRIKWKRTFNLKWKLGDYEDTPEA